MDSDTECHAQPLNEGAGAFWTEKGFFRHRVTWIYFFKDSSRLARVLHLWNGLGHFCSCCYACRYSLTSTGSHFNQFSRHSSPWNTTRSDAGKATSQDPSLEGWSYTILNVFIHNTYPWRNDGLQLFSQKWPKCIMFVRLIIKADVMVISEMGQAWKGSH